MPRKPLIRVKEFPYHVHARSNNQEWFRIPKEEVWSLVKKVLKTVTQNYSARVQSFVLMSNHFHMILWTPELNIDSIMNYFLRELSKKISAKANRSNHLFGGPYKWSIVQTGLHMALVYKYVYRNPVVAGLCETVLDYPYSSLRYIVTRQSDWPFFDNYCNLSEQIPCDYSKRIDWLNEPFKNEQYKLIQKSLRRRNFEFTKRRNEQKVVESIFLEYQKVGRTF